jgi:hypothetical protein
MILDVHLGSGIQILIFSHPGSGSWDQKGTRFRIHNTGMAQVFFFTSSKIKISLNFMIFYLREYQTTSPHWREKHLKLQIIT